MSDVGNESQVRIIAEQIADAAITRFASVNPGVLRESPGRIEIPPPLKWGGTILAAVFTLASGSGLLWLVSTVNTMQVTLARMDERMQGAGASVDAKYAELERRVTLLEGAHRDALGGGK